MLSTLPLFYIAQSVNSDDRRARFQGLRVIMVKGFKKMSQENQRSPFVFEQLKKDSLNTDLCISFLHDGISLLID